LQWFCCCTLLEPGTPDSVLFEGVGAVSGLREKLKTSDHESNWDRIRPAATCTDTVQLRSQASLAAALKTHILRLCRDVGNPIDPTRP